MSTFLLCTVGARRILCCKFFSARGKGVSPNSQLVFGKFIFCNVFWPRGWMFLCPKYYFFPLSVQKHNQRHFFPLNFSHCWFIFNPFDVKTPFLALFLGHLCRLSTKGGSIWRHPYHFCNSYWWGFIYFMTFENLCIRLCIFFCHSKLVFRLLC